MVSKSQLTSIISKYYLNGLNNQVKWRIKDSKLTIYAGESGRVCKVELNQFPLEDSELGVFDTNKLNKLISITNGDLILSLEKTKSIFTKLFIQDSNFNLTYSLADILILGKNTYYDDPDEFCIELDLTPEDIDNLIKAKNALTDINKMKITTAKDFDSNNVCEFIFGDNDDYSNNNLKSFSIVDFSQKLIDLEDLKHNLSKDLHFIGVWACMCIVVCTWNACGGLATHPHLHPGPHPPLYPRIEIN